MSALGFAGDCFTVAMYVAKAKEGKVVHGLPIGRGPLNRGKRFWHAWCEVNGLVYDYANDRTICLPVTVYYRKGKLTEEHVHRYSVSEALNNIDACGHAGPWVENASEMEEV